MTVWSRTPSAVRRSLAELPQTALARRIARTWTRGKLRILGFHGVDDLEHFGRMLSLIRDSYQPITADDVVAAISGEGRLPDLAVWVTFDDGLRSTFDAGPLLQQYGISATAFICPSTVEQPRRLWFQTVYEAERAGLRTADLTSHPSLSALKQVTDSDRRQYIAGLEVGLAERGIEPQPVGLHQLHEWVAQGHSIGNHTWDHPCLDTCSEEDQFDQILRAHMTLVDWGLPTSLFAYPNGNYSHTSEAILRRLNYAAAVLFDHDVARDLSQPLALSRLRIDSTASLRRLDSILSGAHSALYRLIEGIT